MLPELTKPVTPVVLLTRYQVVSSKIISISTYPGKTLRLDFLALTGAGPQLRLRRHENPEDLVFQVHRFGAPLDVGLDLILVTRVCVYSVPLFICHVSLADSILVGPCTTWVFDP